MKIMNHAVDQVRREETKETDLLRRKRYYWLKNPENLIRAQKETMASSARHHLNTVRVYQIRLALGVLRAPGWSSPPGCVKTLSHFSCQPPCPALYLLFFWNSQ